jgi:hypothetical protein
MGACHVTMGLFETIDTFKSCNGTTSQGSIIIVQFTKQTNYLCEVQGWQSIHPYTSSYFSC